MKEDRKLIIESLFIKYEDAFNANGLDRCLNFPEGTMQKFYKYNRQLSRKRINRIYRFTEKFVSDFEKLKKNKHIT
ncbi:hypothetical protein [Aquimarina longa]|uniref:hypothetical protein n=1 Tax=Aquimarina longa TaxID=1080221 RepID=UPI0007851F31|nr:hypothetical protein [Aquimarina longa]